MGRICAVAVAAILAAGVCAVPAAGAPQAARDEPSVVDLGHPRALPEGDLPRVPYLPVDTQGDASQISRPGKAALPIGRGRFPTLMRVHQGFMVSALLKPERDFVLRFVGSNGRRHVITKLTGDNQFLGSPVASMGGRLAAITVWGIGTHGNVVRVHRMSDGKLIARHRFSKEVSIASFSRHRMLLVPDPDSGAGHPRRVTRWWNLRTGKVRVFDDAGHVDWRNDAVPAADLTAGQVAVWRHRKGTNWAKDRHRVVTIPKRPGRAWSAPAGEHVVTWSPDDRYVITAPAEDEVDGTKHVSVRRARDGALVTKFTGDFVVDPVWEDDHTFAFTVLSRCEDGCDDETQVRCTVGGDCERLAIPEGSYGVELRQRRPS